MPKLTRSLPKYRHHKGTGQAVVSINGRDVYLGKHGTSESVEAYQRITGEWVAGGRTAVTVTDSLTVVELCSAYWSQHAKSYYRPSTMPGIKRALHVLKETYGDVAVDQFGPRSLKTIRANLIERGLSRKYINDLCQRIRRVFKWGVSEEYVPSSVFEALRTVDGLRKGRSEAKDVAPVLPVSDAVVEDTLPHLPTVVADMVRFQRFTGCRPGEVCMVRPCDVDTSGDIWQFRPPTHKTKHHGRDRIIAIGPKAQDILRKYLLRPEDNYCFSARESERKRLHKRSEERVTPLSCGNRPGTNRKPRPGRRPGRCYTVHSYRRAVHRACEKAGVAPWSPNQLRHAAATEIRRQFGLEAAQVTLGHSRADVTQVYAERDAALAADVARQVG